MPGTCIEQRLLWDRRGRGGKALGHTQKVGGVTQSPEVGTRGKGLRVHTRPHVLYQRGQL